MTPSRSTPRPDGTEERAAPPASTGQATSSTGSPPPSAFLSAAAVSFTRGLLLVLTLASGTLSAAYFGAGVAKDSYLVAQTFPALLSSVLLSGVYGLVLVALAEIGPSEGVAGQLRLVWRTMRQIGCVLIPVCLAASFFPRPIIALIAPGFGPEEIDLSGRLLPFTMFAMAGTVAFAVFRALCSSRHHFALPGFVNLLVGVVSIATLVLLVGRMGIFAQAVGQLLGALVALVGLGLAILLLLKDPPEFKPQPAETAPRGARAVWRDFLPMSIGANFGQVNLLVDNAFASYLPAGNITWLGFASVIFSNAEYLTIFSLAEVAFARFTAADRQGSSALEEELGLNLRYMLLLAAPIASGCLAFGSPLARLLFERGEFGPDSTAEVGRILACLGPEIVFMGYFACFWRIMFARRRLRTLVWTSVGAMILNALLNLVLMRPLGISGIALSTTCVTAVFAMILGVLVRREGLRIFGPGDRVYTLRVLGAAGLMGFMVHAWSVLCEAGFDPSAERIRFLEAGGGLALGALSYTLALHLQGIRVVREALGRLGRMAFSRRQG